MDHKELPENIRQDLQDETAALNAYVAAAEASAVAAL